MLTDPVALVLPVRSPRWPLWAMMAVGLSVMVSAAAHGVVVSDMVVGVAVFGLAFFCALTPDMSYLAYLTAFAGVFTLGERFLYNVPGPLWTGPAMVALALVIPASTPMPGPDLPPGWFHNPSTWVQRAPAVGLVLLGTLAAHAFKPLAGLFLVLLATTLLGDRKRWRSAPWALCCFGTAAVSTACASAAWLVWEPSASALAAVLAATVALLLCADEFTAARLFLRHAPQLGQGVWDAFWNGGLLPADDFAPRPSRHPAWAPPQSLRRKHSRRRTSRFNWRALKERR